MMTCDKPLLSWPYVPINITPDEREAARVRLVRAMERDPEVSMLVEMSIDLMQWAVKLAREVDKHADDLH